MRRRTTCLLGLSTLVALAACGRGDHRVADSAATTTTDSAAAAMAPPPPPAPIALSALAGQWDMRAVPESGDTTATTYVLTAAADSAAWTMTFPNRKPVPLHVTAMGDSLVVDAGPFESARRKGVQVRTQSTMRLQGDRLVGQTVAHYVTNTPDSVLRLHTEGSRRP